MSFREDSSTLKYKSEKLKISIKKCNKGYKNLLSEKDELSRLQQEFMYWRSLKRGGEAVPEYLRRKAVEQLSNYRASDIQHSLKITSNMLCEWRNKYKSENNFPGKQDDAVFIALPFETKELMVSEKLLLKFSNGSLSMEGDLSLSDWEQALRLLKK